MPPHEFAAAEAEGTPTSRPPGSGLAERGEPGFARHLAGGAVVAHGSRRKRLAGRALACPYGLHRVCRRVTLHAAPGVSGGLAQRAAFAAYLGWYFVLSVVPWPERA